jgi:hypothetical protein
MIGEEDRVGSEGTYKMTGGCDDLIISVDFIYEHHVHMPEAMQGCERVQAALLKTWP